jgi:hypothetical protein
MAPANHIESPVTSLWFVGYSNRVPDALLQFWFWMKQSQGQGAAILSYICNFHYETLSGSYSTGSNFIAIDCLYGFRGIFTHLFSIC